MSAPGRYNKWSEKEPLICNDSDLLRKSRRHLRNQELTDYERWIYYLHELVDCEGIEFVAFSNVLLYRQTTLANNVILTPCFYPETEGMSITDPLVKLSMNMEMRDRYVYDGWIPIVDWDIENVRQAINSIEQVLSTFSLQGRNWFRWEPKYYQNEGKPNTTLFKDENVREIENFNAYLDEVSNITASIGKSAAWLNQSIRTDEPAAKFLFSFLAIESLILYIESSKSDNILHTLKSGEVSNEDKINCIEHLMETTFSEFPIETIVKAYSECVRSLSRKLRENIESIFGTESEEYKMLFKDKIEGSTLYDIRHKIAHGGLNALEDFEKNIIKKRIWDMEKMSRKYLNKVIERISGNKYFQVKTIKSMLRPFSVISHRRMYSGPVHMAYFYT
jgi:hypothetical protein